jgi:hypothetical protein
MENPLMDMTEQLAAADLMRAHAATAGLPALAAVDLIANSPTLLALVAPHIDTEGVADLDAVAQAETLTADETALLAVVDALTNGNPFDLTGLWDLSTRHAATALESMRGRLPDVTHG